MASASKIEWTEATWNPIVGCSIHSPGCARCYAMRQAHRLASNPATPHYAGTTEMAKTGPVFTGKVARAPDHVLTAPMRWRKPRRIFVNSMGDLFHEDVPDEWIDRVFAVMALCADVGRNHVFQILTKRADRMRAYIDSKRERAPEWIDLPSLGGKVLLPYEGCVPKFVWLGVSCERQQEADERIPHLLQTPAAVRFISAEPLLGPIDLTNLPCDGEIRQDRPVFERPLIDWVIVGGESGPNARPMHPDWARSIRDQCTAAGVAFFFKQWGRWSPDRPASGTWSYFEPTVVPPMWPVGKKAAGRLLDGRVWNELP